MQVDDIFPSKYLKASDLKGKMPTYRIANASLEDIGSDRRLVLYFVGEDKGFVTNKTNAKNIAAMYGGDTTKWPGERVTLYVDNVNFKGQIVPAIRVRPPAAETEKPTGFASENRGTYKLHKPTRTPAPSDDMEEDEVPF